MMEHNHQAKILAIKDRIEYAARCVGKKVCADITANLGCDNAAFKFILFEPE
jgi:hypothetical protein